MKWLISIFSLITLSPMPTLWAQLSPSNEMGVTMGHLHYIVKDVEASKNFWAQLGATSIQVGTTEVMKFPELLIFLSPGQPSGGNEDSVLRHVAFRVPNTAQWMERLKASGIKVDPGRRPGSTLIYAFTPQGEHVELFQEGADNTPFYPDEGPEDSGRFSQKMTLPIMTHHIHWQVPEGTLSEAKRWYVKMFGAVPGTRWNYPAADLPGMNLNFSEKSEKIAPSKGRILDHIGFEVENLETFCERLEAEGVKFDKSYAKLPTGIATASFTDPWGASIELTEGLDRY